MLCSIWLICVMLEKILITSHKLFHFYFPFKCILRSIDPVTGHQRHKEKTDMKAHAVLAASYAGERAYS